MIHEEDQRIRFFLHAILKVTWNHPDSEHACMHQLIVYNISYIYCCTLDMKYLDYYQVEVIPASNVMVCRTHSYRSGLLPPVSCGDTLIIFLLHLKLDYIYCDELHIIYTCMCIGIVLKVFVCSIACVHTGDKQPYSYGRKLCF